MTFARIVRLLAILVIVAGGSAWRFSLLAQSQTQVRQYDPAFDGAPASLDDTDWGEIPAYVSAISGDARLDRDGDVTSDFEQVPLQVGDHLRTTRGRVEVLYNDGSVIALDEYSAVTIDADSTWRLHTGRVKVVSRTGAFAVDAAPVGIARLRSGGDYRVTLAVSRRNEPEVELAVIRGSGELENPLGRTLVRSGTRALTTEGYAPSVPYAFAAPRDEFERWTESLEADRYGVTSAQYLPVELRAYGGDFDRYGYWSRHSSHGWVWYPRVSLGWEPFHSGRWSFVIGFGYNWIGGSRWEWPTHHYGRWDRGGSSWFWVPSRPMQWHRIGYSAPRRSYNVNVTYYSRPQPSRSLPSYRGSNTSQRSRIVEAPRGDDRRPNIDRSPAAASQQRVAIPRSSPANRETGQATRPSTFPTNRPATSPTNRPQDDGAFRTRQAPVNAPVQNPRMSRPAREVPQSGRPEVSNPQGLPRERRPSTQPPTSARPAPSVQAPSRPSGSDTRPPGRVGLPDPQRSGARAPAGSRTPSSSSSSSSRAPSGSAVRRGGGR